MKRYIALLLVIVMLLLTACGTAEPSTENTDNSTNTEQNDTEPSESVTSDPTGETTTDPTGDSSDDGNADATPDTDNTQPTDEPTKPTQGNTVPGNYTLGLSQKSLSLEVGQTGSLSVTYTGAGTLRWMSDDASVATVSNGKITAKKAGTAVVTVTDGNLSATCSVEVAAPVVETPVTHTLVITTKENSEIYVGESLQLQYEYTGNKSNLTWKSYKPSVVTVDSNGKVTAIAKGNAIISVTDGTLTRRINIRVKEPVVETEPEYATATSIDRSSFNAPLYDGVVKYAGDSMKFQVKVMPIETNRVVVVSSSDSSVVAISTTFDSSLKDNHVTLKFKGAGTATITLKSADGAVSVSYKIQVKSDYACNPGSGQLTPEQFVSCANAVMKANGATIDISHGWRELTLAPSKLTWATARNLGEGWIHEFWPNGITVLGLEYMGTNDDGNHVFRIHR